jgi:hypothetical protein
LRSDQRVPCGDLNWKPREGIGPPGAAYGYLPEKSSHQNLQKVTGFVDGLLGYEWVTNGEILKKAEILSTGKFTIINVL